MPTWWRMIQKNAILKNPIAFQIEFQGSSKKAAARAANIKHHLKL
jgi:hypothetical protein